MTATNDPASAIAQIVWPMVQALPLAAQVQLERALTVELRRLPEPWQERVAELFFLSALLDQDGRSLTDPRVLLQLEADLADAQERVAHSEREACALELRAARIELSHAKRFVRKGQIRWIARAVYDERRADSHSIPRSRDLVARYGSWLKVCRAATGLLADGRSTGPGRPWAAPHIELRGQVWDEDACLEAVRRCAIALGQVPTCTAYRQWRRAQLKRRPGVHPWKTGLPDQETIRVRLGGWPAVRARLNLTDRDLAWARAARIPKPAPDTTAENERRDALLAGRDPRTLTITEAVALADSAGVSLEWLAGADDTPAPPPPAAVMRLDADAVRSRRAAARVRDAAIPRLLGLHLGAWRNVLQGRGELHLGQLLTLAGLLRVHAADMLAAPAATDPNDSPPARSQPRSAAVLRVPGQPNRETHGELVRLPHDERSVDP